MNPYLSFLVIAVFIIALSFIVFGILRYTSCWNRLERYYLANSPDLLEAYGLQWINIASPFDRSGTFNRFGWVIRVGASAEGVHFSTFFPYDLILRPILIPWSDSLLAEQPFIGITRNELIPKQLPEIQFILSKTLMENLCRFREDMNVATNSRSTDV